MVSFLVGFRGSALASLISAWIGIFIAIGQGFIGHPDDPSRADDPVRHLAPNAVKAGKAQTAAQP